MTRQIALSLPSVDDAEWQAMKGPIESGWLTQGPRVAAFEKDFCAAFDVKHALAVTSCTTGLHVALAAAGITAGDEVIVPSFSWVATANAVEYCGATPVFIDVDPATYNIDVKQIKAKLTAKTKAIIPVHLFGLCADMDAVRAAVPEHMFILEDAACAVGAQYKGQFAGGLADAAAFSFHPRKVLTTGEGGMVTTNDAMLQEKMGVLRNHGASVSEAMRTQGSRPSLLADFDVVGFNYRMTDVQAAMGIVQLQKLPGFIAERQQWANWYNTQLQDISWITAPETPSYATHSWQAYVVMVDPDKAPFPRDIIMDKLLALGIGTRPGTQAIHMLGYYKNRYGLSDADCPGAKACYDKSMALPLHNKMSAADYAYVVQSLRSF